MKLLRARLTDAHEGPVYVAAQRRLYFCSRPDLTARRPGVSIRYWDLRSDAVETWVEDARMANGMTLARDGAHLLVCEQGDAEREGAVARYALDDGARRGIVCAFRGQPFNSPNKVVELRDGSLLLSDPDYGPRQGFRPSTVRRASGVYLFRDGRTLALETGLLQPHGLAVDAAETTLYVSDTAADDGVGGYDAELPHEVYAFRLDAAQARLGSRRLVGRVPVGIPDGLACCSLTR